MMNLFMPTSMAWFSSCLIASQGSLYSDSSFTRWIIQKSEFRLRKICLCLRVFYRILMSCLKYLSVCPCPTCLVQKSKIYLLGSKSDMRSRQDLLRVDNKLRRENIEKARRLIFKGVNVTSKKLEHFLGPDCLIPTRVCGFFYIFYVIFVDSRFRTPFQKSSRNMVSIFIGLLFLISFTNSNWEFGKPFSHIYSESCMHTATIRFRP